MTGCNGVEGITGIEKFKQLRDQGFEWITHTADGCLHRCEVQTEGLYSLSQGRKFYGNWKMRPGEDLESLVLLLKR